MSARTAARDAARETLREHWRTSGWYPNLSLRDALIEGARNHPDATLVFAGDAATQVATLASLHERAVALAGALPTADVRPGSIVAVQAPPDRASTELFAALWLLGAVVVPVVLTATPLELDHILRETGATHLVVTPEWRGADIASQALTVAAGTATVLVIGDDGPSGSTPITSLRTTGALPSVTIDPVTVCCVLYTSGSTALPKGVQHSHETLLAGLTAVPGDTSSRALATFPSGHIASLLGLLRPLSVGGTTVVMDRWSARRAAALIEEHRLDTSAGTPFFLSTLLDEADRSGRDISSMKRFLVGAAAVPPALVARAEARGIVSWRTYGSTEHPAISSGTPLDPVEKRTFTDGLPGPGNEVRLLDEDGNDVPAGETGEIGARGPKQFLGYRNADLDDEAFTDTSWFRTGDLARFDADGYLVVTDRLKDIIIRGGENISAREVEDVLATHAAIEEVAVCAAPDETWGEVVCAFVRPRQGAAVTLAALAEHTRKAGLPTHKAPVRLELVEDFPRTAAGKVRKQELRSTLAVAPSRSI